jgi:hypothetical protein
MFLQVSQASVEAEVGSAYVTTSGIYKMTLKHAEVAATANGATQINYIFDKAMSYGNTVVNKAGEPIFGMKIVEALAATLGEEFLSDPEPTEVKFKNSTKTMMCIPELEDREVKVWLQFAYHRWNGEIKESVNVKRFYRESDGASGSEALTGENIGTQLAKDEKYAEEVKYSDGLTAEDIAEWKKSKSGGDKSKPNAAAAAGFGAASAKPTGSSGFPGAN